MSAKQPQAPADDTNVTQAMPRNEVGPDQGLRVTERYVDPAAAAQQRAAEIDWQVRQNPGDWVRLANGSAVKVQAGMPFKYPGDVTHPMMAHPGGVWKCINENWYLQRDENNETTSILLNPKPPFDYGGAGGVRFTSERYVWLVRTPAVKDDRRPAETAALHRSGKIRYIEVNEIDPTSPIALFEEYATPNNTYVTNGTQILAEIMDQKLSYQKYKGWDDMAIDRARNVQSEVNSATSVPTDYGNVPIRVGNKTATNLEGPANSRRGS